MKKILWMMAGLVFCASSFVLAQDDEGGAKAEMKAERQRGGDFMGNFEIPMMKLNKDLGLTAEQTEKIKAIFSGSTNELKTLRVKMTAAAKKQAEMMSQESPDEDAVLKGADEIAALRAEMGKIRIKQMLAAQKILTPEQRIKMREKMKSRMDQKGVKGMGKHRAEGIKKAHKTPEAEAPAVAVPAKTE